MAVMRMAADPMPLLTLVTAYGIEQCASACHLTGHPRPVRRRTLQRSGVFSFICGIGVCVLAVVSGTTVNQHRDRSAPRLLSPPTRLYTHGDAGFPCIRIPATALQPDGSLLSVAAGRCFTGDSCFPIAHSAHDLPLGTPTTSAGIQNFTSMIARRSVDGGVHWSPIAMVVTAKGNASKCLVSDPTVVVDAVRNRTIVMYTDPLGTTLSVHSDDFGQSWSATPSVVPMGPTGGSHMAPATGIQLSSTNPYAPGRLLAVAIITSGCKLDDVLWSDDGGSSWNASATQIPNCGEAQLAELADGTVVMNCRNPKEVGNGRNRGRSVSNDGGDTWTPMVVMENTPGTSCMGSFLSHPVNKSIVFFAHPTNLTERRAGAVYRSDDGGMTWSTPLAIGETSASQFAYSSLSFLPSAAGNGAPTADRLGLTYETWADGCEEYAPACAIDFITLPTMW
eukprot:m.215913 g.215913  ORF g.215913 m.215913 type:complete len:450 (+) comp25632_c0_seq1:187-1536(+)